MCASTEADRRRTVKTERIMIDMVDLSRGLLVGVWDIKFGCCREL